MTSKTEQVVIDLITPILKTHDDLLWDLAITKEGGQKILRILIDKPNHEFITMD